MEWFIKFINKLKDVLGISKVVDPRKITVSKILKHIHKGKIESVFAIDNNQAEIIHAQVLKSSKLINKNIEGIIVGKAIYDGDINLDELANEIDRNIQKTFKIS